MGEKLNVLVTGLNGVVGRALRGTLEKRYNLSALSVLTSLTSKR